MTRCLVGCASATSVTLIVISVAAFGYIVNDINSFYDDSMEELREFKGFADDAWAKMILTNTAARIPRQVYDSPSTGVSSQGSISRPAAAPP
ncbi:nematode cuticle collagen domain protein, partial [Ancylostoma caninum]